MSLAQDDYHLTTLMAFFRFSETNVQIMSVRIYTITAKFVLSCEILVNARTVITGLYVQHFPHLTESSPLSLSEYALLPPAH